MRWTPHVTVAAIAEENGRFLLVEERDAGRQVLNQPAGHLEPGETLAEAVVREALEETGRRFEPRALVGVYRYDSPHNGIAYLRFCFAGRWRPGPARAIVDPDVLGTRLLSRDEIGAAEERLRSPMVLRCVDDYLAGHRWPLELLRHVGPYLA